MIWFVDHVDLVSCALRPYPLLVSADFGGNVAVWLPGIRYWGMGTGRWKAHSDSWFAQRLFADCHWPSSINEWNWSLNMYHDVYVDLSVSNTFPASIAGLESSAQPNSSPPTLTIGEVWAVPTLTGKDHRPEIGIYSHCIRCRWPKDFTPSWYQAGDEFVKATRTHLNLYETLELASMGSAVRMLSGMSTKFCTWAKTYGAEELFQVTPSRCLVLGKCERTGLKTAGIESERPSSPDSNHRHPRGYAKDTLHQHAIFGEFCFRELLGSNLYTRLGARVFFGHRGLGP